MNFAKALEIAYKAHEGQVDKAGAPYILHCIRVASEFDNEFLKIVAILHDVVEDTTVTLEQLALHNFGSHVIEAIDAITKRKDEKYKDYLKRVAQNKMAYHVKLADIWDNSNVDRFGTNPTEKQIAKCASYVGKRNKLVTLRANLLEELDNE